MDNKEVHKIIEYLKNNNQHDNGVQLKDEPFSPQANQILQVEENISLDFFYKHISLPDQTKLIQILNEKRNNQTTYEIVYRYNVETNQFVWIKEHKIFSYINKKNSKQMEHYLAFYDRLTQLKNRQYFDLDMDFLIHYSVPFSLFLVSLNFVQMINNQFGHGYGDDILKQFSQRIKEKLIDYEFDLYRISGDEFAMLVPYMTKKKETNEMIHKLLDYIKTPFCFEDYQIIMSPSIGITFYPRDSQNKNTLLRYASLSMNRIKHDISINFSYFDKKYYKSLLEERKIEDFIDRLIKEDLITLRYQPIYDLRQNKVVCYETLFYNGSYSPEILFKVALKSSLIIILEKKIVEKVFHTISDNQAKIPPDLRFTINLTPKTFEYLNVYQEIKGLLEKYHIKGQQIGLELTEQYFIYNEKLVNEKIQKLQSLGIKIYLDDFGMGYSSVRNLTSIFYDFIKLDKQLIGSVFTNHRSQTFIKSIFQFSKEIQSDIIVEGVETKEQLDYLQTLGAAYIQGYYLSKPIEINEALKLIKLKE